jgi:hypothetical protein
VAGTELAEHPDGVLRRLHADHRAGCAVVAPAVVQGVLVEDDFGRLEVVDELLRAVGRQLAPADDEQRLPGAESPAGWR